MHFLIAYISEVSSSLRHGGGSSINDIRDYELFSNGKEWSNNRFL
jgi:hypothetical protein